ncbi:hypothetical protein ACTDI4_05470 [Mesorhizobium sp. PUT5]|uniref:hypothetical protein n=1 Tax=Mesorhizobium sp. PUT5 TaxID=3454629 RepID=UPI003FA4B96B
MTNAPTGAVTAAACDKYYVYRPMLDLIGKSEGTDKGRGYNEMLASGAHASSAVDQIDALQRTWLR